MSFYLKVRLLVLFLKSVIQTSYDVLIHHTDAVPKEAHSSSSMTIYLYYIVVGIRRKTIHGSVATCFCHGSVRKWKNFFNNGKCPLPFGAANITPPVPAATPCLQRTLY